MVGDPNLGSGRGAEEGLKQKTLKTVSIKSRFTVDEEMHRKCPFSERERERERTLKVFLRECFMYIQCLH